MFETIKEPIIQVYGDLKWWNFNQNNSGGYFIENDEVGSDLFIQSPSRELAMKKAQHVVEDHSEYCDCCGERWSVYYAEDEGSDEPEKYGKKLEEYKSWYGKTAILHHADGKVERYTYIKDGN